MLDAECYSVYNIVQFSVKLTAYRLNVTRNVEYATSLPFFSIFINAKNDELFLS